MPGAKKPHDNFLFLTYGSRASSKQTFETNLQAQVAVLKAQFEEGRFEGARL
jgi:hypothetical protein